MNCHRLCLQVPSGNSVLLVETELQVQVASGLGVGRKARQLRLSGWDFLPHWMASLQVRPYTTRLVNQSFVSPTLH